MTINDCILECKSYANDYNNSVYESGFSTQQIDFARNKADYYNQIAEWLEELKELRIKTKTYDQIVWERNLAIEQLEELGGLFGEKTELIKARIYNKAIDDIKNALLNNDVVDRSVVRRVAEQLKI